jgi:hypothetical protein
MAGKQNPLMKETLALGAERIFQKPIDKEEFIYYLKDL